MHSTYLILILIDFWLEAKRHTAVVCLKEKHVNLSHIESRRSKRVSNEVEIYAECNCTKKEFNELVQHLKDHINIVSYNTPQHVWSAETGELELTIVNSHCNYVLALGQFYWFIWCIYSRLFGLYWVGCQMGKEYHGFPKRSQSWTNALIEY